MSGSHGPAPKQDFDFAKRYEKKPADLPRWGVVLAVVIGLIAAVVVVGLWLEDFLALLRKM